MTKFRIIAVGKLPAEYIEASKHLTTMLGRDVDVIEILSKKNTKEHESELILEKVNPKGFTILLDVKGSKFSSEKLADLIQKRIESHGNINFIIGGAFGVTEEVKNRADISLSFSDMTFPHMLARIMLLEQLYRGLAINSGHPYHK